MAMQQRHLIKIAIASNPVSEVHHATPNLQARGSRPAGAAAKVKAGPETQLEHRLLLSLCIEATMTSTRLEPMPRHRIAVDAGSGTKDPKSKRMVSKFTSIDLATAQVCHSAEVRAWKSSCRSPAISCLRLLNPIPTCHPS